MALKHQYESESDIPEQYRELYSEKGDRWEITGIVGLKTQADVDRVQSALTKEREAHKATRDKFQPFAELGSIDELHAKLDRIPELEAAAKGKLDENAIEEMVQRRVDGVLKSRTAPLDRQIQALERTNRELTESNARLTASEQRRELFDALDPHVAAMKIRQEHVEDVRLYAERHFERTEDGQLVTKDGVGVTPGLTPKDWLAELVERRPGWTPASQGAGARGSGGAGGAGGKNPFSHRDWNMTEQGRIYSSDPERATRMAEAAGTTIGGPRPPAPA